MEPTLSLAFNNRGFARLAKGEHDRAIADFGEAIRLDPRDVLPLKHRGEAYWITGDLDRALRDYEAALALAPGDEVAKKAHDAVKAAMGTSTAPQESRSRAVNERRIALVSLELRTTLTRVRSDVLRATGGEQRPETSDSLDGEVVLKPLN
jgi:tetratricopeptide (TPR) repeat protein